VLALVLAAALAAAAQSPEVIADIQVHGNVATPDAEIVRLAGIQIGEPVHDTTIADVAARLRATGDFERVEVLKRFASIVDPTRVTIVIVVDEGRVHIEMTGDPAHPTRVVRDRGPQFLFLPIVDAEDGYGLSYGARITVPRPTGSRSRLSVPLTWGGDKRAALEYDKAMDTGPLTRVAAELFVDRREHPFFHEDDTRVGWSLRAERAIADSVRLGANAGWQRVSFLGVKESFTNVAVDAVVDTRLDPVFARNAVYARAAVDRFGLPGRAVDRLQLDGRGYVGLFGQNTLVLRGLREDSDRPLPAYLKPMLGGMANLRGFRAGTDVGDTLAAASAEVIVPVTSPFRVGRVALTGFVDAGALYDKGERLSDQAIRRGIGGSLWFSVAVLRLNVAVAHGIGATTRVHVSGGISF
jgi:outer membrane protein assembly factor BamA